MKARAKRAEWTGGVEGGCPRAAKRFQGRIVVPEDEESEEEEDSNDAQQKVVTPPHGLDGSSDGGMQRCKEQLGRGRRRRWEPDDLYDWRNRDGADRYGVGATKQRWRQSHRDRERHGALRFCDRYHGEQ